MNDAPAISPAASVDSICGRWIPTRYGAGQCCVGAGVDCVRFVNAILSEICGRPRCVLPREAQDAAFHDSSVSARVCRIMRRHYRARRLRVSTERAPGDVVAVGCRSDPFHVGIVGADTRVVWHASPHGVTRTSFQAMCSNGYRVLRLYRCLSIPA